MSAITDETPPPDPEQGALFDLDELEWWRSEWQNMPAWEQDDLSSWTSIKVHFESAADLERFAVAVGQPLTERTRYIWYPNNEIERYVNKRFADDEAAE